MKRRNTGHTPRRHIVDEIAGLSTQALTSLFPKHTGARAGRSTRATASDSVRVHRRSRHNGYSSHDGLGGASGCDTAGGSDSGGDPGWSGGMRTAEGGLPIIVDYRVKDVVIENLDGQSPGIVTQTITVAFELYERER
jgi:hypothetical protein